MGQARGEVLRRDAGTADRHTVALDHDLAPADALSVGAVVEGDRAKGSGRRGRSGDKRADHAQGRQAALARRQARARRAQHQVESDTVHGQRQVGGEVATVSGGEDGRAGRTEVAAGRLQRLERRDLGQIEDLVDDDPLGRDADARVVVDGEVAQGVGQRGRRHGQRQKKAGQECHASPRSSVVHRFLMRAGNADG